MSSITTEKVGSRIYVVGNTFDVKDRLKSIGCHFDFDRKQWWIGSAKSKEVTDLVNGLSTTQPNAPTATTTAPRNPVNTDSIKLVGKAKYKGKAYYVQWVGTCKNGEYKCHLYNLDGSIDFWVKCAQPHERHIDGNGDIAAITKTYQVREFRGQQEYTTLGSIRRFIERQTQEKERGGESCAECGKYGILIQDLEDGMMKCRGCCDMPA